METFEATFAVTFNPREGFVSHKEGKVTINIVLENVFSVHDAKKVLAEKKHFCIKYKKIGLKIE